LSVLAVSILPLARVEIIEAHDWYERRSSGLGGAFADEVDRQLSRIAAAHAEFPIVVADARRARLRRFPYSLIFRVVADEAFVVACFHASRDPRAWQART